jgi:pimeloyl-ACP methyl ester carboxylesterase
MSPALQANPAVAFYGGSRAARWLGGALRAAHRVAPSLGTHLALRLFFTPLPLKTGARRRPAPAPWRPHRHPFEGGSFVLWRRLDIEALDPHRPQVLLVHGWAGDAMQMRPLGDALAQAGLAPLLLDLPAHGRSDGWRSTLPQFVRALFAVQARVGPLRGIVGHSLGALASGHAAAKGLAVERLALLAPSPPPAKVIQWFAHGFGIGDVLARRMKQVIEGLEGIPLDQFEPPWLGARLTQPTLIVHDRADKAVPPVTAGNLAHALPNARLVLTDGLGHRRVLSEGRVMQAVIAHLLKQGPRP